MLMDVLLVTVVVDVLTVDITQNDTTICEGDSLVYWLMRHLKLIHQVIQLVN